MAAKQNQETRLIKGMLTGFRGIEDDLARGDAETQQAVAVLRRKISVLLDEAQGKAQSEVLPVTHVIQITPGRNKLGRRLPHPFVRNPAPARIPRPTATFFARQPVIPNPAGAGLGMTNPVDGD
ncbi:MAG: hypothetical protein U1F77_19310 [Kiritimatiellia bacterium]